MKASEMDFEKHGTEYNRTEQARQNRTELNGFAWGRNKIKINENKQLKQKYDIQ